MGYWKRLNVILFTKILLTLNFKKMYRTAQQSQSRLQSKELHVAIDTDNRTYYAIVLTLKYTHSLTGYNMSAYIDLNTSETDLVLSVGTPKLEPP